MWLIMLLLDAGYVVFIALFYLLLSGLMNCGCCCLTCGFWWFVFIGVGLNWLRFDFGVWYLLHGRDFVRCGVVLMLSCCSLVVLIWCLCLVGLLFGCLLCVLICGLFGC